MSDIWEEIYQAIVSTEPDETAAREKGYMIGNEYIFRLVQELKSITDFDTLPEDMQEKAVQIWYETYKSKIADENGESLSWDEVWLQFKGAWPKAKYPKNKLIEIAVKKAKSYEPFEAIKFTNQNIRFLISFCYQLQLMQGDEPFWLSSYIAGKVVGKSQAWGFSVLTGLVEEVILKVEKKGNRQKATRYHYIFTENQEQYNIINKSPNPELTEEIIMCYRKLIRNKHFQPNKSHVEKFIKATNMLLDFSEERRLTTDVCIEYFYECLAKNYRKFTMTIHPGHLCSDNT